LQALTSSRRRLLEPLILDLGTRLSAGKQGDVAAHTHALSARDGLPILPLDRQAFLNVQARSDTSQPRWQPP